MNEPQIRDLFRVMIVDHNLDHIREMQQIDFAKEYQIKPYFVYYGEKRDDLPQGVYQYDTLENIVQFATRTKKVEGIISRCRKNYQGKKEIYGITLAQHIRSLEQDSVCNDIEKRMPIMLHGEDIKDYKLQHDHREIDLSAIIGSDIEYMMISDRLKQRQVPGTKLLERAHIVTHNLNYDPGEARIYDRLPHVMVTERYGLTEDELKQATRMMKTGVDGIMLGINNVAAIDSTMQVVAEIRRTRPELPVTLVWTGFKQEPEWNGHYHEKGNDVPKVLQDRAAREGVRIVGKHQMGVEAARVEQAKTGMPKHPVFLRRNEGGTWRDM